MGNAYDLADEPSLALLATAPGPPATTLSYEGYGYDAAGNLASLTDADGRTTATTYDGDNRVLQSVATSSDDRGTTTITSVPQYDPNGNQTGTTTTTQQPTGGTETHTIGATYDTNDTLVASGNDGLGTAYGHDPSGDARVETILGGRALATMGYDAQHRLTSVSESAGGAGPQTATFGYTPNDLLQSASLPGAVQVSLGYDPNSALTALNANGPNTGATGVTGTTLHSQYNYTYNAAGYMTSMATLSGTDTLAHDASGRLIDEQGLGVVATSHHNQWTYDANGNLLTATDDTGATNLYTYTVGAARDPKTINAIQQMGATGQPANSVVSYGYDSSGDVTSIANGIDPTNPQLKGAVNQSVRYDAVGRPVRVTTYDHNIPTTISLSYDAGGERSDYRIQQASTGLNQDYQFGYRGDGELAQVTVLTGGVPLYTDSYLYGPTGAPLELLRQRPGGSLSRYWYVLDGQGSVVALTDANGTVVDRYAYDQWGELTSNDATDERVAQQLRYHGYWYDEKLSWYWLGLRYYDPETARMLQPDPLDLDGAHTYAYADDNPTDEYDLLGLFDCPKHGIWFVPGSSHALHGLCLYLDKALLPAIGLQGGIDQMAGVVGGAVVGTYNVFIGDDVATLRDPSASGEDKALALASLLLTVIPADKVVKLLKFVGRLPFVGKVVAKLVDLIALAAHDHLPPGVANRVVQLLQKGRDALGIGVACAACFAVGTLVATPAGAQPIQALHVGDTVLAENPTTGVVEGEPVEAVIQDPMSPLIAVQLSDGSAITVTADHPFWVDSGALFKGPGWLAAGQLLHGDRLRIAKGGDATVAGVRRGVGQAVVYTLTVAKDHTFFVGDARVLVHNADPTRCVRLLLGGSYGQVQYAWRSLGFRWYGEIHHITPDAVNKAVLGLRKGEGPAILMSVEDHALTLSNGKVAGSGAYQAGQIALIQQGRYLEAVQLDIDDIHRIAGTVYDSALKQMLGYTKTLFPNDAVQIDAMIALLR